MTAVLDRYEALLAAGELKPDTDQRRAVASLDRLAAELEQAPKAGFWSRLAGKTPVSPRGIYMWGGVGRGKSMLMDLACAAIGIREKRRVHFHEFMLEVHRRLRSERAKEKGDPIPPVAKAIATDVRLLAFDEMVINNSADAMILSRLFANLLEEGVSVIATSNRPPRDLYLGGLNRELFMPFIDLIEQRLEVVPLNGPTDYRLLRLGGVATWHVPAGSEATEALRSAFFRLTDYPPEDRAHVPSEDIEVPGGRNLHVPKSLKGVAVFSFKRLCGEPRGAADYLAIARRYHSVIIVGIPRLGTDKRNEAARFVTLIDALYEHKVKLLASADAPPEALYPAGDGAFEFERTISRLIEMQSHDYLARGHGLDEDVTSLQ
ncbi:cell division protein ZapE [Sphingosinicella rhizophila]|uniref:Cell division protein ZapE n=1 Tax=Sphingosinicella rhizophila TaxID=3050082 RepID=A0ABU3Q3F5_9SPHN|nr:cell division protein ZapE [Sphingosinicella sp. GR2756]MDT9597939.1 cell division protein ZapE [Sphingosinicella sp. GR2756]